MLSEAVLLCSSLCYALLCSSAGPVHTHTLTISVQPFTTVYIAVQMLPTRMRSAPDSIFFNTAEFASSLCHSPITQ